MELALYCPHCGYYEQEGDNPGRRGDYFTSVSVGRLFGELLAFQFAEWLSEPETRNAERGNEVPSATPVQLVEAGTHDGKLARDILTWLRERRPGLFGRLGYGIVEPSVRRQDWQRRTLAEFGDKVRWVSNLKSLIQPAAEGNETPRSALRVPRLDGVLFSNELLDAMPVHRLGWDAKRREWFELGVALDGERFVWARMPEAVHDSLFRIHAPTELLSVLPDGFTTEVCPAATHWWREAASVLGRGKLLTLDYGLTAEEFFAPHRRDGTLRAYRQHQLSGDVLANPGEQDLTAHVNFTDIQAVGEAAGLTTESFVTQAQFLVRIAEQTWRDKEGLGSPRGINRPDAPGNPGANIPRGEWDADRLRQFKTLTHPEHLGRAFRVLVQAK